MDVDGFAFCTVFLLSTNAITSVTGFIWILSVLSTWHHMSVSAILFSRTYLWRLFQCSRHHHNKLLGSCCKNHQMMSWTWKFLLFLEWEWQKYEGVDWNLAALPVAGSQLCQESQGRLQAFSESSVHQSVKEVLRWGWLWALCFQAVYPCIAVVVWYWWPNVKSFLSLIEGVPIFGCSIQLQFRTFKLWCK